MNRLKSYYNVSKYNNPHHFGINPHLTTDRFMLRFANTPLNIYKKYYCTCVCDAIETELRLFFNCKFHNAARAILCTRVCDIVSANKLPEVFDYLSNHELLHTFVFGLPDDEPSFISSPTAVFCAVDEFRKVF